jgi:tRNA threonylcarbamoyladenosine biosynthesis protein TsaB
VQGIVAYQGPGSFTGLRIGLTVANALAYSLKVPIVATAGDQWVKLGQSRLTRGESDQLALPEYGAPVHITLPKK